MAGGLALAGCVQRREPGGPALTISSSALTDDGTLPERHSCRGVGVSPPLSVDSRPDPTGALAVVAEADLGVFNKPLFWVLWNLPADIERVPEGVARTATVEALGGARQSSQPGTEPGYVPPCPPLGRETTLLFDVFALEEPLDVEAGANSEAASEAVSRAQLSSTRISVTYTRTTGTPTG
jgi:phosphatidylethanolamine-binding protein (PEBP) family uncharacterized protein